MARVGGHFADAVPNEGVAGRNGIELVTSGVVPVSHARRVEVTRRSVELRGLHQWSALHRDASLYAAVGPQAVTPRAIYQGKESEAKLRGNSCVARQSCVMQ